MDCSMRHAPLKSWDTVNVLRTATQSMPAAIAARSPRAESSIATASLATAPNRCKALRYGSAGLGCA